MAHISSIGAALFTDLSVSTGTIDNNGNSTQTANTNLTEAGFKALFAYEQTLITGVGPNSFTRLGNVREFPSVGTPPNIVNVPVFGQKQTSTVQAQADAPTLEVTINYIPSQWSKGTSKLGYNVLGNMIGDGISRPWRFTLLQTPSGNVGGGSSTTASIAAATAGAATGCTINGNIFTIGTYTSGVFRPGTVISGTGVTTGTTILDQLSGTAGGSSGATYLIDTAHGSVASFAATGATGTLTLGGAPSADAGFDIRCVLSGSGVAANTKVYGQLTGNPGGSAGATFSVNNATVVASTTITATGANGFEYASTSGGLGTVVNSQYFWNGKLEAMLIKPDLKDALTATLTLSIQSDFYGAFTNP